MIRPRVVALVAWRDLRRVLAGRRLGFIGLALALLLPVGAIPVKAPEREAPPVPAVQGEIPPELEGTLRHVEGARVTLEGTQPVTVITSSLPGPVRAALNSMEEEPSVTRVLWRPELRFPGRNLLVALLAISLLTGPLAESLPGEREQGTLETLLTAAISRGELVGGKWLAWTAAASLMALLGGGAGLLTGAQSVGLWVLGVPLAVSVAVALGLWLVRSAGDAMSGATAPMRIIPVVAVALLGVAWWLSMQHPVLAAAVPLGGGLLLAGGMVEAPAAVLAALLGTASATAVLLAGTARALAQTGSRSRRSGGLVVLSAVLWGLPVLGPELWRWAGRGELVDAAAGQRAGGALLILAVLVVAARDPSQTLPERPGGRGALAGLIGGLLLAGMQQLPGALEAPVGWTAVLVVLGQELWFRGVLLRRVGGVASVLTWVVVVGASAPLQAAASGALLWWLSSRYGVFSALAAAGLWRLLG